MKSMTKQLASEVASAIIKATIGLKIDQLRTDVNTKAYEAVKKTIPEEVVTFYEKYPRYCRSCSSAYLSTEGLDPIYIGIGENLPNNEYSFNTSVPRETYEAIKTAFNKLEKMQNEQRALKASIETTLCSLKTLKRIKADFSQALPYLPDWFLSETETAVTLPIKAITEELAKYA